MAFVCTLNPGNATGNFFQRGDSFGVLIPIGYDDDPDADKSYNLFLTLDPLPTDEVEFLFRLIEHDGETDTEYAYWSGRDVSHFIQKKDREEILAALLGALHHILGAHKPPRVLMCTMDTNPPQKAHEKFFRIAALFEECGYVIRNADPYHGQQAWWMERSQPSAD